MITGSLRKPADFNKALAMGACGVERGHAGDLRLAMRACHTNNCPVGIATQEPHPVNRLVVEASVELMQVMARACGHDLLSKFNADDLTTWKREMHELSGVAYGGVS